MIKSQLKNYLLPSIFPPAWAASWGEDDYGVFAELHLDWVILEMRWIPPGEFTMGSPTEEKGRYDDEGPQHQVTLTEGFWLADSPCTQSQWDMVMGKSPDKLNEDSRPVVKVSWEDCREFMVTMNETIANFSARFPTEAEWEYACRAGSVTAFNSHENCSNPEGVDPALDKLGWYVKNSGDKTHDVKLKNPNAWGLYDMHGNVWEWCKDWHGPYKAEQISDPAGPESGRSRVVRGGSYWSDAGSCRSAYRIWRVPELRYDNLGFRLAAGQF